MQLLHPMWEIVEYVAGFGCLCVFPCCFVGSGFGSSSHVEFSSCMVFDLVSL
jgi:hypothetical protein